MKTANSMTLTEAMRQFLEYMTVEKGSAKGTVEVYARYLRRFRSWAEGSRPNTRVTGITIDLVRQYRLYLSRLTGPGGQPLKQVSQTYHVVILRAFLKYLLVQRDLPTLQPEKISLPRETRRAVGFLTSDQVRALCEAPDTSTSRGKRDRAILETLFSTGLRVAELVSLDRTQIDLERREFSVIGKGNKPRVAFLSDSAVEWLRCYLASRVDHCKPLFIRHSRGVNGANDGESMRLTTRTIQLVVSKYAQGVQVKASPHTLRHSFATDLLRGGADIRSVQEMLGHESIRTTQVYTHVTDRQLREIHQQFHNKRNGAGGAAGRSETPEILEVLALALAGGVASGPGGAGELPGPPDLGRQSLSIRKGKGSQAKGRW